MNRARAATLIAVGILLLVAVVLAVIFPSVLAFVEMAARELRYLWWLVLLVALGAWLVWGTGRGSRR